MNDNFSSGGIGFDFDVDKKSSAVNEAKGGGSALSPISLILLLLAAFFTAIVETGFFLNFRPLGTAPDLSVALVTAVALRYGMKKGAVCGIMSGFFGDAFSQSGISLLIPFLFALGIIAGMLSESKGSFGFGSFMATVLAASFAKGALTVFELCLTAFSFDFGGIIVSLVLPHIFITLVFSPLMFLIVRVGKKS